MRRNGLILAFMIFLGAGLTYFLDNRFSSQDAASKSEAYLQGMPVPAFTVLDQKGQSRSIDEFKGKIVVLNFWATWCAPCVKEMPLFLDLAKEYPERVVFLGLSNDFNQKTMESFLNKMAAKKPKAIEQGNVIFALDENGAITREIFQTFRLPETIIIDTDGIMRDKLVGADWTYEDLMTIIHKY